MNKFFVALCTASAALFAVTPASAAIIHDIIMHEIIVQRPFWMSLFGG